MPCRVKHSRDALEYRKISVFEGVIAVNRAAARVVHDPRTERALGVDQSRWLRVLELRIELNRRIRPNILGVEVIDHEVHRQLVGLVRLQGELGLAAVDIVHDETDSRGIGWLVTGGLRSLLHVRPRREADVEAVQTHLREMNRLT